MHPALGEVVMATTGSFSRTGMAVAIVLATALALSACGRRGALEPPPNGRAVSPDGAQLQEAPPPQTRPARPFILDPLI